MSQHTTESGARRSRAPEGSDESSEWCETVGAVMTDVGCRQPAAVRLWDGPAERQTALDEWFDACRELYIVLDTSVREEPRTWMEKRAMASRVDDLFGQVKKACLRMPR